MFWIHLDLIYSKHYRSITYNLYYIYIYGIKLMLLSTAGT